LIDGSEDFDTVIGERGEQAAYGIGERVGARNTHDALSILIWGAVAGYRLWADQLKVVFSPPTAPCGLRPNQISVLARSTADPAQPPHRSTV
jgi:hypothetical protein